jgi:hypothetical protein
MLYSSNLFGKQIDDLDSRNYSDKAEIIIIDKILADSVKPNPIIEKNKIFQYKKLEITLETCWTSPKDTSHNGAMVLINEIVETIKNAKPNTKNVSPENSKIDGVTTDDIMPETQTVFHGWIFSDNHAISHLEHPIYQVYLAKCVK